MATASPTKDYYLDVCSVYMKGKPCTGDCHQLHICRPYVLSDSCSSHNTLVRYNGGVKW